MTTSNPLDLVILINNNGWVEASFALLIEIMEFSHQCKIILNIFMEERGIFKTNERACYEV